MAETQVCTMADVIRLLPSIEWLWSGWLPRGLITLLIGVPGVGKTSLGLEIARCVVEPRRWPDDAPGPSKPHKVIWCDTESAQAVVASRIAVWGLPAEKFVLPLADPLETFCLHDKSHQAALETRIRSEQPDLIVLDSLSGAHRLDENSAQQMKPLCEYIAGIAKDYHIGLLAIHHVRKAHIGEDARINLDRVRGSSVFIQFFRSILAMQEIGGALEFSVRKLNMGEKPDPVGIVIHEYGLDFIEAPELKGEPLDQALEFLRCTLTTIPMPVREIVIPKARSEGIGKRQLYKAKRILGVQGSRNGWSFPVGMGGRTRNQDTGNQGTKDI